LMKPQMIILRTRSDSVMSMRDQNKTMHRIQSQADCVILVED